jgi:hypothetical protein
MTDRRVIFEGTETDHSRVRMNTIAKSETTTVRLQKVCVA